MKKYIIGLFLMSFMLVPVLSFAQVADPDPNPTVSDCVTLQSSNLRYKARDINTNGEVSTLQDFLQSQGYLNNEPTGYFGLLTQKAVKDFQKAYGISPTGYVGPVSREKIKTLSCGGIIQNPNNPVISGVTGPRSLDVNQTGTWKVSASDINGGSLSYSVDWGDINIIAGTPYPVDMRIPQSATFTHSYAQAGTYTARFTVTSNMECFVAPCPSGSTTTSLTVNVGNVSTSSITVLSPNGGETLVKGNSEVVKWQDNETYTCRSGMLCVPAPRYYDISLTYYNPPCTTNICPIAAIAPYIIAQKVYGSSYDWKVGDVILNGTTTPVSDGKYVLHVCRSGGGLCDSSDSYFKIISSVTAPTISGVSGPQTLNVNETGTWTVNASSSNGGTLSYSVNWGDEVYATPMTNLLRGQTMQQSATFTHSYSQVGTYSPTFTVTNNNGQNASTSLSVNIGGGISNSSITVLSPNGGETLYRGNNFQINWRNNDYINGCPTGANCNNTAYYGYYDINLVPSYPVCASGIRCSMIAMPYRMPYTIAQNVYGSSFSWQVGSTMNNGISGATVPAGAYTIHVCKSGTDVCDSSNSAFTIQ